MFSRSSKKKSSRRRAARPASRGREAAPHRVPVLLACLATCGSASHGAARPVCLIACSARCRRRTLVPRHCRPAARVALSWDFSSLDLVPGEGGCCWTQVRNFLGTRLSGVIVKWAQLVERSSPKKMVCLLLGLFEASFPILLIHI